MNFQKDGFDLLVGHLDQKQPDILFGIQLLGDDIDQLSRDGFDWIIRKVIFKVGILFSSNEVLPIFIA